MSSDLFRTWVRLQGVPAHVYRARALAFGATQGDSRHHGAAKDRVMRAATKGPGRRITVEPLKEPKPITVPEPEKEPVKV